jgi:hypothetical protein
MSRLHGQRNRRNNCKKYIKECTDTSYGHAVALTAINTKKRKSNADEQNAMKKKCKCGSETHQRITHKDCPENPKYKELQGDSTINNIKDAYRNNNSGDHETANSSVTSVNRISEHDLL